MEPYYARGGIAIYCGDNREVLPKIDVAVSAVVTDPPYGLSREPDMAEVLTHWLAGDDYAHGSGGFMGKTWDSFVPGPATWRIIADAMLPGAHLLAFAGTRTSDLMGVALRLAGLERRDTICWLAGSGFPKSLDVGKAIDRAAGAEREVVGRRTDGRYAYEFNGTANRPTGAAAGTDDAKRIGGFVSDKAIITAPATDAARQWDGWGTALKPAHEDALLCRKPFATTVANNVLEHGTGALNIDKSRIGVSENDPNWRPPAPNSYDLNNTVYGRFANGNRAELNLSPAGRWPPNVALDESAAALLDAMSGQSTSTGGQASLGAFRNGDVYGKGKDIREKRDPGYGDTGGASRYFPVLPVDDPDTLRFLYCAKASRAERNAGLEGMPERDHRPLGISNWHGQTNGSGEPMGPSAPQSNHHPTVKPLALMRWLLALVSPPGGIVLDPFGGSFSTLVAAAQLGIQAIGIDLDPEYCEIGARRVDHALNVGHQAQLMEVLQCSAP